MTKLHSYLKKGLMGILSLTLILSNTSVYAIDDTSDIIIEEDNLEENTLLQNDEYNDSDSFYNDNSILNENQNSLFLLSASNQEDVDITFNYNGGVQSWTAPYSGFFFLEVYGAEGGPDASRGGYGGYVKTYIYLEKNTTLYIACGQKGWSQYSTIDSVDNPAYNGGARAGRNCYCGGTINTDAVSGVGGGATSITTTNRGELKNFENYKDEVLVVAGGGAGGSAQSSGEGGSVLYTGSGTNYFVANGVSTSLLNGKFALGSTPGSNDGGGGGGGWIGGVSGLDAAGNSAGGGASFINTNKNCYPLELVPDNNKGNGHVRISNTDFDLYYNITYNLNGGTANNPIIYGRTTPTFTLNNPTKNGYTFTGWTGSNGSTKQTSVSIAKGSTGDKTYTANWTPTNYTITYNLDGGSANNPSSYNIETDTFTLSNPTKNGYTFIGWTGSNGSTKQTSVSIAKGSTGDKTYTANWNINQYNVTYIDVVGSTSGKQLGKTTKKVNYNSTVRGSDIGSSTSDNAYYNGYYYSSDTSATVTTSGTTVYRIFKLRTIDKTSNLTWNDNNNKNGFRPSKYTLKLMRNGSLFKQVELASSQTSYTFSDLTKYDSNGNAFKYTFQVDASDRYKISLDENGNTITENYQNSTFSVIIPKTISLNGNTGTCSYKVTVSGTFYYNDTLTVIPSSSFTLKDGSGISTLQANVTQNVTTFTKDNLGTTSGSISLNKTKFAGKFNGTFNFNIKFTLKN